MIKIILAFVTGVFIGMAILITIILYFLKKFSGDRGKGEGGKKNE